MSFAIVTTAAAWAADPAPAAKKTTLMPLGDSITEGGGGFSVYRYPLLAKLRAAGYQVESVGSRRTQSQPKSPLGELSHEGYSGQTVEFLDKKIDELYRANPADIILLHAGHNHFAEQRPVPPILAATRSLIAKVRAINPRVTVLLAQVIPSGKLPKYEYIPELNENLAKLAAELDQPEQRVVLVNQAEGFDWNTDTIGDHVHPNAQGAEKMAAKWFAALVPLLPPPAAK